MKNDKKILALPIILSSLRFKLELKFSILSFYTGIPAPTLHGWLNGVRPQDPIELDTLLKFLNDEIKKSTKFTNEEKEKGLSYYYLMFGVEEGEEQSAEQIQYYKQELKKLQDCTDYFSNRTNPNQVPLFGDLNESFEKRESPASYISYNS